MFKLRRPITILLLVVPAACAHAWPDEGHGGLAERDSVCGSDYAEMQAVLEFYEQSQQQIGRGSLSRAEDWFIRAKREHLGGLELDAEESLLEASILLGGSEEKFRTGRVPTCFEPIISDPSKY